MDKLILTVLMWLFFLGGLFGFAAGMFAFLTGGSPAVYGVMGIGGGFWLLSSAITIHISSRLR